MSESKPRSPLAEGLILAGASLAAALVMLGILEIGLRVTGIGDADASGASRLKYQQIHLPILVPGERPDGTPVFQTADRRLPHQSILREKPANGLRVATFGGSATAGLGFSPNATFARELERMLVAAYPDRSVEVVNVGIVALASRQVKLLAEDFARRFEPDLLIVYSGNNEFLEVHAEKYAAAHATLVSALREQVMGLNLYRALQRAVRGAPDTPSLAEQDFSREDLQLTQHAIIQDVEMTPQEIDEVVADYGRNIREMVEASAETGTPLMLLTVASNWKWRGRSDLPDEWLEELLGEAAAESPETWRRARSILDERLAGAPPQERHEWLFKRAIAAEALGDEDAARAGYRAAINEDPHLRRALDSMAEQVLEAGRGSQVPVLDTIELLGTSARGGIVGFEDFYDYVHFTPRGVALVAGGVFRLAVASGLLPPSPRFDLDAGLSERLAALEQPGEDDWLAGDWLGYGADPERIHDRDLWKYDRFLQELDTRLEEQPDDVRALVYRGNARSFAPGAEAARGAERDYREALRLDPSRPEIRANLDRLLAERSD